MEPAKFSKPEKHPFEIKYIPRDATHLVIGSFPTTIDKMAFNFFYPNSNNKFWKIVSRVFQHSKAKLNLKVSKKDSQEVKERNIEDRKLFCVENKFGLTDMISKCFRFKGNSKDEFLLVQEYVPILNLLKEHKTIHTLILTGNSPATSAHHHFYQYLVMNKKTFKIRSTENNNYFGEIIVEKRLVKVYSLNSTSSRGSNRNEERLIEQYKSAFRN